MKLPLRCMVDAVNGYAVTGTASRGRWASTRHATYRAWSKRYMESFGLWPSGLLDLLATTSLHGLSTASVPAWAAGV